jgi:hypothetical protein
LVVNLRSIAANPRIAYQRSIGPDCSRAADEIERLRETAQRYQMACELADALRKQRDIERIRTDRLATALRLIEENRCCIHCTAKIARAALSEPPA